jgi:hypothetical protein
MPSGNIYGQHHDTLNMQFDINTNALDLKSCTKSKVYILMCCTVWLVLSLPVCNDKVFLFKYSNAVYIMIIIIISPLQFATGYRPLQLLAISLDPRLLASRSCQPSYVNRHSTWPESVLHYVYRNAVSTPELVYPSGCRRSYG